MENNLSISQSIRFNIDFYFVKYPEVNELMAIPFLPVTVDMAQFLSAKSSARSKWHWISMGGQWDMNHYYGWIIKKF